VCKIILVIIAAVRYGTLQPKNKFANVRYGTKKFTEFTAMVNRGIPMSIGFYQCFEILFRKITEYWCQVGNRIFDWNLVDFTWCLVGVS
jgi:hypothetical protein